MSKPTKKELAAEIAELRAEVRALRDELRSQPILPRHPWREPYPTAPLPPFQLITVDEPYVVKQPLGRPQIVRFTSNPAGESYMRGKPNG